MHFLVFVKASCDSSFGQAHRRATVRAQPSGRPTGPCDLKLELSRGTQFEGKGDDKRANASGPIRLPGRLD